MRFRRYFDARASRALALEFRSYYSEDAIYAALLDLAASFFSIKDTYSKDSTTPRCIIDAIDFLASYIEASVMTDSLRVALHTGELSLLGRGSEGYVFTDYRFVYKVFALDARLDFLEQIASKVLCELEFEQIEILGSKEVRSVIKYRYEEGILLSDIGQAPPLAASATLTHAFASLLCFGKDKGFIFTNFKPSNFIMVDDNLGGLSPRLIDYGASFKPFSKELFTKHMQRAYACLCYHTLDDASFRSLISEIYKYEAANRLHPALTYSYLFILMVEERSKEDLHDGYILDEVSSLARKSTVHVLDFGAGKCKIANTLDKIYEGRRKLYDVKTYDIDIKMLKDRSKVAYFTSEDELPKRGFDVALLTQVLCCTPKSVNTQIIVGVKECLRTEGRLVLSICNPFFSEAEYKLLQSNKNVPYKVPTLYEKRLKGGKTRPEYHRPLCYYKNLLERNGFIIDKIGESDSIDIARLLPASEHLFITTQLRVRASRLPCTLFITVNPMEHKEIDECIEHIVLSLERGEGFTQRIVVVDDFASALRLEGFVRARCYERDNLEALLQGLELARQNSLIDKVYLASELALELFAPINSKKAGDMQIATALNALYKHYFNIDASYPYADTNKPLATLLLGFHASYYLHKTRYVFHTDSDIIYHNSNYNAISSMIETLRQHKSITLAPSIMQRRSDVIEFGTRVEARTSLIDLEKMDSLLPLPNSLVSNSLVSNTMQNGKDMLKLSWHRSMDIAFKDIKEASTRARSESFYFIHPNNELKTTQIVPYARYLYSMPNYKGIIDQAEKVELSNTSPYKGILESILEDISLPIVYSRGRDVEPTKLKRLFDSLIAQDAPFFLVYLDDASSFASSEYARYRLRYDAALRHRSLGVFNSTQQGTLRNLCYVMENICTNKSSVIINVDSDDALLPHAISTIMQRFRAGAKLTLGNCFRTDKPLKHYSVKDFYKAYLRGGDNLWLHPKCFTRELFDAIMPRDLEIDGRLVDVCCDFAIILPMVDFLEASGLDEKSACHFIDEIVYYFDPSSENKGGSGKYAKEAKAAVLEALLEKSRQRH